jgi:hypothetical protein
MKSSTKTTFSSFCKPPLHRLTSDSDDRKRRRQKRKCAIELYFFSSFFSPKCCW